MDLHRQVRDIIRQELATILMSKTKAIDTSSYATWRATAARFPSDPNGVNRLRMIQQFGVASQPPAGMDSALAPIGGDPTHLILLGQDDPNRPPMQVGECALYSATGQVVYLKLNGKVLIGSQTAENPAVLGDVLCNFIQAILNQFLNAPQIGFDTFSAPVFLDPGIRTGLTLLINQYITSTSTNIVSQQTFLQRGGS
jgi:hypothetical protein